MVICIKEFFPAILDDFARRLNIPKIEHTVSQLGPTHSTKGFHFTNVLLADVKLSGQQEKLKIKIPIPNQHDLFVVNDTFRIFATELTDGVISVRTLPNNNISLRWQFLIHSFISDEDGLLKVNHTKISLYTLFLHVLGKEELSKYIPFEIYDKNDDVPNSKHIIYFNKGNKKINLPTVPDLLHPLQNTFLKSILCGKKETNLDIEKIINTIEDAIDPITKIIYKIKNIKDLCMYTLENLYNQKPVDLVGSNLFFKRIRSLELIMRALYIKLIEIKNHQRNQTRIRFPSDYLLKIMFTDATLQKLFEYLDLRNLFMELSLRYKVAILIDHLPYDMRDVHSSYLNRIDLFDTPDDEKIGARQQLALNCELDYYGRFI